MTLNNIILVPTDFSEVCDNAIEHAMHIAEMINFKVCIYHVINKDSEVRFKEYSNVDEGVQTELQHLADKLRVDHQVIIETAFQKGSIFDLIHKKAAAIGANIIMLGTHGKKGFQKLFGSYALKVITQAQVPTIVVQKKKFQGLANILFPINSFTEARQKVGYAVAVASRFNSTIHIYKEKINDPAENSRIQIISKQISDEFKKAGIKYTTQTADKGGESAKSLVDYAIETSMDMVMIVTEPQIGTSYFNLGPWNEKIMFNEAQIPVMCLNPVEHGSVYFDI